MIQRVNVGQDPVQSSYLERILDEVDMEISNLLSTINAHETTLTPVLVPAPVGEGSDKAKPVSLPDTIIGEKVARLKERLEDANARLRDVVSRLRV